MTSTGPPRLVLLPCVLLLLLPVAAPAETLVVRLVVNGEAKADVFAERTADGDFLVRPSDLAAAGLREPKGTVVEIGGEPHLSLRSIRGVRFAFDEKTLSLNVTAAPEILPAQTIDFAPRRQTRVSYPKDTSAFLNYRVGYTAGDSFSFRSWDAAGQAGLRTGDVLFLTDFSYTKTPSEESLVRLQSSAACDRRETMQRAVAGDVFASSGDLGGSVNLGGASFSKVYRINPYFLRHPLANVSGLVALPSDVEIRLDGMLLRTEKLPPGPFELTNLDYYGGASRVTVVIKDPFGREERLAYPFYFTDVLLRKGLHEYSYNAGFLREDFGVRSNRYGAAAFSVFHNYGVSDALTVGARAEGGDGMANLGPQAFLVLPKAGVLSASVSLSRDGDRGWGAAALLGYSYQDNATGARLFAKGFSTGYAVLGEGAVPYRPKYEAGAGAGYGTTRTGSVSLDLGAAGTHGGPTRRTAALTYSRKIADSATLFASYRKSRDVVATDEAFAGITYALSPNASVSASYKGGDGVNTETA